MKICEVNANLPVVVLGENMKILASGNSMFPTLLDGIKYDMNPLESEDIKVGDIIVFCSNNQAICHRVVKVIVSRNGTVFYATKGDNCEQKDDFAVTREMIIGKVMI